MSERSAARSRSDARSGIPERERAHVTSSARKRRSMFPCKTRARRSDHWLRELLLAAVIYEAYNFIQHVLTGSTGRAQRNGRDLLNWEQVVHLDPERFLNHGLGHITLLAVPACYFYATLHFIVTPVVLIWTYRWRPAAYRQARSVLLVMTVAALAGFWLFPAAPPRLLIGGGFSDTLTHFSGWGWWGSDAIPSAASTLANPFAAMPSLHVGWALWCGVTLYTLTKRLAVRVLAVSYPILTTLVVLATGNHYLLDAVAGAALWLVAHLVVAQVGARASARHRRSLDLSTPAERRSDG